MRFEEDRSNTLARRLGLKLMTIWILCIFTDLFAEGRKGQALVH